MHEALLGPYEVHSFAFYIHMGKENLLIASVLIGLSHWGIQRDGLFLQEKACLSNICTDFKGRWM